MIFFNLLKLFIFSSSFSASEIQNLNSLKMLAYSLCQQDFNPPNIPPIAILDPPTSDSGVGLIFQEELSVTTNNFLDENNFYFNPRPRAAVNNLPVDIYVAMANSHNYQLKTWEDASPDYSSPVIQPPILKNEIPPAGRVLTELIIGHKSPQGDFPQLFDLRSSAYFRFSGFSPQVSGATLRLAAHRIFGTALPENTDREDFPILRKIYVKTKNASTAHAYVLAENHSFCGALDIDFVIGSEASMVVDSFWYTRHDHKWQESPHTALVAYSSMLWKDETNSPEVSTDEAHDSDTLRVLTSTGDAIVRPLSLPNTGIKITHFGETSSVSSWSLANEDRDPEHYADFYPALGPTNYDKRVSYRVEILRSNVKTSVSLYEQATDAEYADNIVAASTIRQNIKKSKSIKDAIHFKYKTTAYYP